MQTQQERYKLFEQLFRENYNQLANYAYSVLKNTQDAEDAVQDVFVRIWQKEPAMITQEGFKYYLLAATRNTCISLLRKQASRSTTSVADMSQHARAAEDVQHQSVNYQQLINNALSQLPPQCLAIFKLSRFANLSYRQIADELNLSVKTVENQMGKALKIMREYARKHDIPLSLISAILYTQVTSCILPA